MLCLMIQGKDVARPPASGNFVSLTLKPGSFPRRAPAAEADIIVALVVVCFECKVLMLSTRVY